MMKSYGGLTSGVLACAMVAVALSGAAAQREEAPRPSARSSGGAERGPAPSPEAVKLVRLHVQKFLKRYDRDNDGKLSRKEFTALFDRLDLEGPLDIKRRADSLGRTILFAGYSLSDINMRYLFYKLQRIWESTAYAGDRPRSYIFLDRANPVHERVLRGASRLVLPGVGAFRACMEALSGRGFDRLVRERVAEGTPLLGVCVGMQMLFTTGHENGMHRGLDIFPGEVVRFEYVTGHKVPHMGWNEVRVKNGSPMWTELPQPAWFYFVHSYYVVPKDPSLIAAETDYPTPFTSAIWKENVAATQFHPEKSQRIGLTMLRNFVEL